MQKVPLSVAREAVRRLRQPEHTHLPIQELCLHGAIPGVGEALSEEWPVVLSALTEMRCAQKEGSASRVLVRHRPEAYGVSRRHDFAGAVDRAGGWFDRYTQGVLLYRMVFRSNNTRHASAGCRLARAPGWVTFGGPGWCTPGPLFLDGQVDPPKRQTLQWPFWSMRQTDSSSPNFQHAIRRGDFLERADE